MQQAQAQAQGCRWHLLQVGQQEHVGVCQGQQQVLQQQVLPETVVMLGWKMHLLRS
jgi:hypothetical protein